MNKFIFFIAMLMLASCAEQEYYPPVYESFVVINETNRELQIKVDSFDIMFFDDYINYRQCFYFSIEPVERLWLSTSQFEVVTAKLKIFYTDFSDTIFVNPNNYLHKSDWTQAFSGYEYPYPKNIENTISITSEMFNN